MLSIFLLTAISHDLLISNRIAYISLVSFLSLYLSTFCLSTTPISSVVIYKMARDKHSQKFHILYKNETYIYLF